ncbi:ammonium transporter [Anseongella ginsenosidimutans]|uniref:Ammonium transporter n=1 Tax=Anseongella ginsenosidimutans TaxID=496056 RepID=A0A4R3KUX9_9SPHI|nr:ammonium transporter [Anseongella ginsenosidimutans]QEC53304.1 ammonium transporter [Anseongella ginsenosidimutans]TCS88179.1 ammonium transporter [Anseongella ginsenosidimutans]
MKKIGFKSVFPLIVLALISIVAIFIPAEGVNLEQAGINSADVAWILVASTLVFLMTPGLSFFYGGMVNRKNVISTMLQSFIATGLISVIWVVVGFSLAFGESVNGFIGNPATFFFFSGVAPGEPWSLAPTIPLLLFALFQMKFAVITPALVVGAVAERIRFTAYILFMVLFSLLVYAPIAHWTWHPDGILFKLGVLDFAGGTVVHISAGCAALAGALILKRRKDHIQKKSIQPANIPFVLLGTGLLWFGWFGFNAGSALGANGLAASAFATTNTATAAAGLGWILFDAARGRKPSALGFCIGAVVGMVAITPAAGFVGIPHSMFIGLIASIVSNLFVHWKSRSTIDDTLDVFPCHGVGGIVGMLLTGVFASSVVNAAISDGWWYGNIDLFKNQLLGMLLVVGYSFCMSWLIFKAINLVYPLRVSAEEEELGLDVSQHDEKYLEGQMLIDRKGRLKQDEPAFTEEKQYI